MWGGDEIEVSGFDLGTAWDGVGMAGSGTFGSGLAEVELPGAGILGAGMLGTEGIPVEVWEGTTGTRWVGGSSCYRWASRSWVTWSRDTASWCWSFHCICLLILIFASFLSGKHKIIGCGIPRCIGAGSGSGVSAFIGGTGRTSGRLRSFRDFLAASTSFTVFAFSFSSWLVFWGVNTKLLGVDTLAGGTDAGVSGLGSVSGISAFFGATGRTNGRFLSFRDFLVVFTSLTLVFWGVNTNFLGVVTLTGEADTGVSGLESGSGVLVFGATGRTSGRFLSFRFCLKVLTCLLSSSSSLLMGWFSLVFNPQGGESWRLRFLSSLKTTRGEWSDPFAQQHWWMRSKDCWVLSTEWVMALGFSGRADLVWIFRPFSPWNLAFRALKSLGSSWCIKCSKY